MVNYFHNRIVGNYCTFPAPSHLVQYALYPKYCYPPSTILYCKLFSQYFVCNATLFFTVYWLCTGKIICLSAAHLQVFKASKKVLLAGILHLPVEGAQGWRREGADETSLAGVVAGAVPAAGHHTCQQAVSRLSAGCQAVSRGGPFCQGTDRPGVGLQFRVLLIRSKPR